MRHVLVRRCLIVFALALIWNVRAEQTSDYAVQVSATVAENPPSITLSWPAQTVTPSQYRVYRKNQSDTSFGSPVATLSGGTRTWTDHNVSVGNAYEYQIDTVGGFGHGYIFAGIKAPLKDLHGKVILVVDNSIMGAMPNELNQLQQDLTGDGWQVIRHDVGRGDTPPNVKKLIQADYQADSANVKAVFLFGHVPVPYSGDINPDGHAEHKGAWGADCYYGIMGGNWSDSSVNDTQSSADGTRNWNRPGDGKFDQSTLPQDVVLQVGRVDLGGLNQFLPKSETDLLKNYLVKDHNFRMNQLQLQRRGIVDDNFGTFSGEAFAANGWRNFAPMFGASNITVINSSNSDANTSQFFGTLSSQSYLWACGVGPGSFFSCQGVGKIDNFAQNDPKCAFYMVFGSFFGDWDSGQGNYMRGPLGSQTAGLASVWAGRPNWYFHHMALGETLGYAAVLAQNNNGLYPTGQAARQVHIALMGDPTLHMHTVQPASGLSGAANGSSITLNWNASTDSNIAGYHVYRATSNTGPFSRVTSNPIGGTSYTESAPAAGTYTYIVRAIKLETSASGTYYNPSQGVFATVTTNSGTPTNHPPVITSVAAANPNPATVNQQVAFTVTATDADGDTLSYAWNYGDGASDNKASHAYANAGSYTAKVTVTDGKGGSVSSSVTVVVNSSTPANKPPVITSSAAANPNPANVGQSVTFVVAANDPDGDTLTINWNYGDGASGAGTTHTYAAAGKFTATATISDGKGATVTSSVDLTVNTVTPTNHPPVITTAAAANPNPALVGQEVNLSVAASDPDNDTLTVAWDYGDGNSGADDSHTYAKAGNFTAKATVSDGHGGTATSSVKVSVKAAGKVLPVVTAALHAWPRPASPGDAVLFTIGAASPLGLPLTISYDYGDGSSGTTEKHTYANAGSYPVVATITDSKGNFVTSSTVVLVADAAPVISTPLQAWPSNATVGEPVVFTISAVDPDGDVVTVKWYYGDGTNGDTETHTYQSPGNYSPVAIVSDGFGGMAISTTSVTVTGTASGVNPGSSDGTVPVYSGNNKTGHAPNQVPPVITAPVHAWPGVTSAGEPVIFTISVSDPDGAPVTITYDYGDGSSGTVENHTYANPGSYAVTATVSDAKGRTATTNTVVIVNDAPPVISQPLQVWPSTVAVGEPVLFTIQASDPDGDPVAVKWYYGDGNSGTVEHHTYSAPGTYTVVAVVDDGFGGLAVSTTRVTVLTKSAATKARKASKH